MSPLNGAGRVQAFASRHNHDLAMHNYRASLASTRSRLSMHPRGRESIFASDPYRGDEPSGFAFSESLRECVLSMEDCCEEVR